MKNVNPAGNAGNAGEGSNDPKKSSKYHDLGTFSVPASSGITEGFKEIKIEKSHYPSKSDTFTTAEAIERSTAYMVGALRIPREIAETMAANVEFLQSVYGATLTDFTDYKIKSAAEQVAKNVIGSLESLLGQQHGPTAPMPGSPMWESEAYSMQCDHYHRCASDYAACSNNPICFKCSVGAKAYSFMVLICDVAADALKTGETATLNKMTDSVKPIAMMYEEKRAEDKYKKSYEKDNKPKAE